MPDVGSASLQIIPSFKGFQGNLERGTSGALVGAGTRGGTRFGDAAGRSAGRRFGSVFRTAAGAGLVGLTALGVGAFKLGKDAIAQASDLNESLNAVNVTYGKQSKAVRELGQEAADSLGLSNAEFNGLAVQFSAFATQVAGGEGPKVVGVLEDLAQRGADFASVMNLEVNEAMGLFQSGLAGETEPLRKFGIDLSAAKVEAYAYAKGIAKQGDELTEAEKVQARYGSLMEQTSKTAGDFANTSDSLANRQRILNARWDDAQAKLGTALLPIMEDVAGFLLDEGIPAFEKASDWFVKDGIPAISDFAAEMKPVAMEVGPALADVFGIIRDTASEAAPYVKDLVGFFNDLPSEAKVAALATALGGYGALKIRGGKGGALGGVGSILGSAKPVHVFETNPLALAGGGTDVAGGKSGGKLSTIGKVAAGTALPLTVASALSAAGSYGVNKLQQTVAPKAYDKGISGTPNFGTGLAADGFLQDMDKVEAKTKELGDAWVHTGGRITDATKDMIGGVGNFDTAAAKLPKQVVTKITAPGADYSRKEALALARQYDLTPREKRTLFRALDVDRSKSATKSLQDVLQATPREVNTRVSVSGVDEARNKVDGLIGALNNVTNAANDAVSAAASAVAAGSRGRTRYSR